LLKL
jgi:hypothetical protein